jgi:EAL domain-containing protein (putative c-di-GMP-specific phosphodiesterase class I)
VEIVESSYLNDQALVCEHISKLKTYGIDTVIDDFGTGYSSLFMLANLPVNQVKLDRQFLVQAQTDKGKLLYQHVVNIFIQMGYTIVAEGIETEQELNWIKSLGVQVAQGWYYAKALPAKDIMEFKLNQAQ